ncbi:hypothetical protein B2D07_11375 [Desulfococcus multivorans]|nr:uncharacterized protein Dmul_22790 [Desulfococcus multivorans]AQV01303.1 hypothetical protein B2D07_11375 [Desulfococcus multivorans]
MPKQPLTVDQLNNIDCLTCHQEKYRRKGAPPYETLTCTGIDGKERTWTLPEEDSQGNFQFMPDETAAATVQPPMKAHV